MEEPKTLAALARRTADTRRRLVNLFGGDLASMIELDLMGVERPTTEQAEFSHIAARAHRESLARAVLYLADPDMVDLLDVAAPTMPDQPLRETDPPAEDGFIFFATPLPDRSGDGPAVPVRALAWAHLSPGHPILGDRTDAAGVLLTAFVDVRDQVAAYQPEVGPVELTPGAPGLLPNATVVWVFGSLIGEVFGHVAPAGLTFTPGFYQRVAAAFWTLSAQESAIAQTPTPPGPPADQRRARRAGVRNATAPVRLVRLRAPARQGASSGAAEVDPEGRGRMKVRALTRGHWRRQWYASSEEHRHIWVDPFWRGPADAPTTGAERVFLATPPRD